MFHTPVRDRKDQSDEALRERYNKVRHQVPLLYVLICINAAFLGFVTYQDVPLGLSLGVPAVLCGIIMLRAGVWIVRDSKEVTADQIRRYLRGSVLLTAALSAGFGTWGVLLFSETDPVRSASVAFAIFVASLGCCYCLYPLPAAGRLMFLLGAAPVTLCLLLSRDSHLVGTGVTFLLIAAVVLRTLSASHTAFAEVLNSRGEMRALLSELRRTELHYRYSVDLNPQIPWIADARGGVVEISPRWAEVVGARIDQALGYGWAEKVHPEDLPKVVALWESAIASGDGARADTRYRLRRADGGYGWFRSSARPRKDDQGNIVQWYGSLEDIDEQVRSESALRASEERYRLASRATNDVIWDWSVDENRVEWSEGVDSVFGYPEARSGTSYAWWLDRVHPDDRARVSAFAPDGAADGVDQWTDEFRFLAGSGEYLSLLSRGYIVRDESGQPVRLLGALQDVTARNRAEEELRWAANHDPLTQLPNRKLFAARLERALEDALAPGRGVGLIVLDVDDFKTLNDTRGHVAGDTLLQEVAARLLRRVPVSATVARLGGDEFAVVLPDLPIEEDSLKAVRDVLQDVNAPFEFDGHGIEMQLSAGAAIFPRDGENAEELLKSADLALYSAKAEGPGHIRGFRPALRRTVERDKTMLTEARDALADQRIVPFYQPKICLRTGALIGFEALLRWHHHRRGLQPPAVLKAAFSDSKLGVQLTERMLDCVIADIRRWRDQGCCVGRVAVNGSTQDFRRDDFAEMILGKLARADIPTSCLELEVTEMVFLGAQLREVERTLRTLRSEGVTIALDDFGTGYASLTHLKQFPVDTIKIDRAFVSRLTASAKDDAAIVGAIIDLGRNLGIFTVAEGVETQAQADLLRARGCDIGQGFLYGRAGPASRVPALVANWLSRAEPADGGDWAERCRRELRASVRADR